MLLRDDNLFLVVAEGNTPYVYTIRVERGLENALARWSPSSRLSPIFQLLLDGNRTNDPSRGLPSAGQIVFIGPANPTTFLPRLPKTVAVWCTLGLHNIVLAGPQGSLANVLKLARSSRTPFESFRLRRGLLTFQARNTLPASSSDPNLAALASRALGSSCPPELRETLSEFLTLYSTAEARANASAPQLLKFLQPRVKALANLLPEPLPTSGSEETFRLQGLLTSENAALSRFCSQAFSGVAPFLQTECHFWTHSLFGTGIANLALQSLVTFVDTAFSPTTVWDKVTSLLGQPFPTPEEPLHAKPPTYWTVSALDAYQAPTFPAATDPPPPILTYFSGRDGFKSNLTTISAPLAAITACSSPHWSLLTLTHELLHIFVRYVLAKYYPSPETNPLTQPAVAGFLDHSKVPTYADAVTRHLVFAAASMEEVARQLSGAQSIELGDTEIGAALHDWQREIEELIVHVLDLRYFYASQPTNYVPAIWLSWSTIPEVTDRAREYVLRTLCALSSLNLPRLDKEELARTDLSRILTTTDQRKQYPLISKALELLASEQTWEHDLKIALIARRPVVQLAAGFLHSSDSTSRIQRSRTAVPSTKRGRLLTGPVVNPLAFLERATTNPHPSSRDSVWLLYSLAFGNG